jgi:trehalose 6-phosphate phosphatase
MRAQRLGQPPAPRLNWAYFLDVDGTLIHFADTPEAVTVDRALVELVTKVFRETGGALALVSGRMISDLHHRFAMSQLPLAGLHGLERRDSSGQLWFHTAPLVAKSAIKEALAPALTRHSGLLLEDKGLTLALHYRRAPRLAGYVHQLVAHLVSLQGNGLEVQPGKYVVEIKPAGVDKGTAIAAFLSEQPFRGRRPVFIGDDLTDERGFAEVNKVKGVTVKVGPGPSCACFRLPDVTAVHHWLGLMLIS